MGTISGKTVLCILRSLNDLTSVHICISLYYGLFFTHIHSSYSAPLTILHIYAQTILLKNALHFHFSFDI